MRFIMLLCCRFFLGFLMGSSDQLDNLRFLRFFAPTVHWPLVSYPSLFNPEKNLTVFQTLYLEKIELDLGICWNDSSGCPLGRSH